MLYTSEGLTFGLRPNALGLRTGPHSIRFRQTVKKFLGNAFLLRKMNGICGMLCSCVYCYSGLRRPKCGWMEKA